jgi:hypothetical protein
MRRDPERFPQSKQQTYFYQKTGLRGTTAVLPVVLVSSQLGQIVRTLFKGRSSKASRMRRETRLGGMLSHPRLTTICNAHFAIS